MEQLQQAIFGMISALSPGVSPEHVAKSMQFAYEMESREDFQLTFDTLFNPEKVAARPRWGVQLHHKALQEPALIHAPKRINGAEDEFPDLMSFALTYGLLTSPPLRAVLMAHGWRIEFVDIAEKPKSPIILAH